MGKFTPAHRTPLLLVVFFLMLLTCKSYAQNMPQGFTYSPGGVLENVFDRYGNHYSLSDLAIQPFNQPSNSTLISCSGNSVFNLYFEQGSGMEGNLTDQTARREVVCKVFEDVSKFINTPLSETGNKVNIWIRDFNNVTTSSISVASIGSGFYNLAALNNNYHSGSIVDTEVWKTLHTGVDSYANVGSVLVPNSPTTASAGLFYHGMIAINFNTGNHIQWQTNLRKEVKTTETDLYTEVLHQVLHLLGMNSLMNQNGVSVFGSAYNYFSRYDTFLKNNSNNTFLLGQTGLGSTMYNKIFDPALSTTILAPSCSLPNNLAQTVSNTTTCSNAIKFFGAAVLPVYVPQCFEIGSSLSHFEDMLFPTCAAPYGNDSYFVMSNLQNNGQSKRYPQPEERLALNDLGFSLNSAFGSEDTLDGYIDYGGNATEGILTVGINDGLNADGTFAYTNDVNQNILLSNFLGNDLNATSFEGLQDLTDPLATLSATTGSSTTNITLNSSVKGVHLLRYVPKMGAVSGNITYMYAYVKATMLSDCTPNENPNSCELVLNGNFEQKFDVPTNPGQIEKACGWSAAGLTSTPDYCNRLATLASGVSIPSNNFGYQDTELTNLGYAVSWNQFSLIPEQISKEIIKTKLKSPLAPNTTYQLSFDVSLTEIVGSVTTAIKWQAYLGGNILLANNQMSLPVPVTDILKSNHISSDTENWDKITIVFTTNGGGEEYLYLGVLNNVMANVPLSHATYYIDNVSLIPIGNATFNLPSTIACPSIVIPNLINYVSNASTTGVFSGEGVTYNNGVYSLNTIGLQTGIYTISYTYGENGCQKSLYQTIHVYQPVIPTFSFSNSICSGSTPFILPTVSDNGVEGTWSPSIISNTVTAPYTFTPNPTLNPCANPVTITINVLSITTLTANNDVFSITSSSSDVTTSTGVLDNDYSNSNPLGNAAQFMTVVPVSILPAGITLNTNGTITVTSNVSSGSYTIQYQFQNACGTSNPATVIITVTQQNPSNGNQKVYFPNICYSANTQTTTASIFDAPYPGLGYPNVYITNITPTLPNGYILNSNGTVTVLGGTAPMSWQGTIQICPLATPGANCVTYYSSGAAILKTVVPNNYNIFVRPGGGICSGYDFQNIYDFDTIYDCGSQSFLPASPLNTDITVLDPTGNIDLNINSGAITILNLPTNVNSSFTLHYRLCRKDSTVDCAIGSVTVTRITNPYCNYISTSIIKAASNNPKPMALNDDELTISPNPSTGLFNLSFFEPLKGMVVIEVYNAIGQKVHQEVIENKQEQELQLSNLPSGTYILKVSSNGNIISKKIIKN